MGYFIFHPYITAPLLLLALALIPAKSKLNTGFNILIVGMYVFVLYKVIPWPNYGSYYLRYFYIFLFLLTCGRPVKRIQQLPVNSKKHAWLWLPKGLVMIFLLFVFSEVVSTTYTKNVNTINLEFPLKNGIFYTHQGGMNPITNYHSSFLDKYAYDFDRLNQWGRSWSNSLFRPEDLNNYNIFEDTVYSPCDGEIIEVIEHYPDHNTGNLDDFNTPANKIVIEYNKCHVELLHISRNSVAVNEQDSVTTGQPLALVGNTGRSRNPHLHIHAYNPYNFFDASVVILFDNKVLKRNDIIKN